MRPAALFLLLAALGLVACSPQVARFRYLELAPDPALEVLASGRPAIERLVGVGQIPLRYALTRADYVLYLEIPPGSYLPSLQLSLQPDGLRLRPREPVADCANWYQLTEQAGAWQFGWPPDCRADDPPEIRFDVLAPDGRLLGSETIAFSLRSSGWYYLLDAP